MVGNISGVGSIVESMYASDNIKMQQGTPKADNSSFSNYLDRMLLSNYQTGFLMGNGMSSSYSYLNALSGMSWQNLLVEALREELQKKSDEGETKNAESEDDTKGLKTAKKKKPDWATIRVIQHYKSPIEQAEATVIEKYR